MLYFIVREALEGRVFCTIGYIYKPYTVSLVKSSVSVSVVSVSVKAQTLFTDTDTVHPVPKWYGIHRFRFNRSIILSISSSGQRRWRPLRMGFGNSPFSIQFIIVQRVTPNSSHISDNFNKRTIIRE